MGKAATESDVATTVCFLASSASSMITGTSIIKDGGYVTPTNPGYSVKIKDSSLNEFDYNNGTYWK